MSECIPKKKLPSKKNLPWISNDLLRAMKLRNKLFKAYKRTGNHYKLSQYKLARNCITKEVRRVFLKALTPPIQNPTGNCSRHLPRKSHPFLRFLLLTPVWLLTTKRRQVFLILSLLPTLPTPIPLSTLTKQTIAFLPGQNSQRHSSAQRSKFSNSYPHSRIKIYGC